MKKILFITTLSVAILTAGLKVPVAFKTNFKQKITNTNGKVITYRGKLKINSDGDLKWSYTSPTKKEICNNGQVITMVDHNLEQVTIHSLDETFNLAQILRNATPVKASASNATDYTNKLYRASYQGRNYTIGLDAKKHIDQIAYMDNMDNRVNIHFTHMKYLSKTYGSHAMTCKSPNGYDIVNQ